MLEKLAQNHKNWIRMVVKMGCPIGIAEDIVQEMYLRLHQYANDGRIMYNDEEVNRFYVYVTLRNLYYDYYNAKKKVQVFSLIENDESDHNGGYNPLIDEVYNEEEGIALQKVHDMLSEEIHSWHWYDAKLCNTYFKTDDSLRKLAKETGISVTSLFNSIKNYKQILQQKFGEDVQDLFNEDYDLI
jgi:DNA-directed RNA polymerase specialized sigma subunit